MKIEILPAASQWHGRTCPVECSPVGYAYLIERFQLRVPIPLRLFGIGTKQRPRQDWEFDDYTGWTVLEPRYWPKHDLRGQLTFALKYEGVDLAILKRLFVDVPKVGQVIEVWVNEQPNSLYARRCWFWWEWLGFKQINPIIGKNSKVFWEATNIETQFLPGNEGRAEGYIGEHEYAGPEGMEQLTAWAKRYFAHARAKYRLPIVERTKTEFYSNQTPNFAPIVYRTPTIDAYLQRDWAAEAAQMTAKHSPEMLERAAAFMLQNDSKASFNIEDEEPSGDRNRQWAQAIGQTLHGQDQDLLTHEKLEELQQIIIGKNAFIKMGIRQEEEGFIGQRNRLTNFPEPAHISARAKDLDDLLDGLIHFAQVGIYSTHPIIAAAILAFGFVYIHPFEDGNGRLHRYLIHYVLSKRGMHPPGMIFPISVAILRNVREYEKVLSSYSARALPCIDWRTADDLNVEVLNDTADLYRYWDATPHVEFLFKCVEETITIDLPKELEWLSAYDRFQSLVDAQTNIAQNRISLLFNLMNQNDGKLSKGKRQKQFPEFKDEHVALFESLYAKALMASGDD